MVFDVSSSINAHRDDHDEERGADVRHDLTGTPSQIAMFSFGTEAPGAGAPANLPLTRSPPGTRPVIDYINGLPANPSSGSNRTNWDAGLFQVAQSTVAVRRRAHAHRRQPDGLGSDRRSRARRRSAAAQVVAAGIEEAVASANAVKNEGHAHHRHRHRARTCPVDNLRAISGPGDAFVTNFDQLAALLRTARDRGVPGDRHGRQGGAGRTARPTFTPAGGWTFNTSTPGVTPTSGTTAPVDRRGQLHGRLLDARRAEDRSPSTRCCKPGWNLVQQGGLNA